MNSHRSAVIITTAFFMFMMVAALTPNAALAVTRVVVTDTTQCPADTVNTPCYTNLNDAITAALAGDAIEIHPGVYTGNFTINKSITSIYGTETARTFLTSGGTGAALTLASVTTSISIKRLSFFNSATGISVQSSQAVSIVNNIFDVGPSNTAIQLSLSPNAVIDNNAFYQSLNGIISDSNDVNIKNNIFSFQSATAISSNVEIVGILNNLFFQCTAIGPSAISFDPADTINYKGNLRDQDPLFVTVTSADAAKRDFHLQTGSPCINSGSTSVGLDSVDGTTADMGAYGGPDADTTPFQVQNVVLTTPAGSTTIVVSWDPNNAYTVKGYKLYYGTASGVYNGTGATEGSSPITLSTGTSATSATLTGLASASTPSTPVILGTSPRDGTLVLSWEPVSGATGYKIYYSVSSFTTDTSTLPSNPITLPGDATSYPIAGLTNYQNYYTAVSAISQNIFYIAVTAIDGQQHESDFSVEKQSGAGEIKESQVALFQPDYPEPLVPYPTLPNSHQGCFIATAAYGYYSAPQVQALRVFRDRYLLTNGPGIAFVKWYYTHGPAAAAWLDAHPGYKPVVRAALLPAVGLSLFMIRASLALKTVLLMTFVCLIALAFHRRRLSGSGGSR